MSSSDKPEVVERDVDDEEQKDIKNTYDDIKLGSFIHYTIKFEIILENPLFGKTDITWEKSGDLLMADVNADTPFGGMKLSFSKEGGTKDGDDDNDEE
ncbi:hypothetical protein QN277_016635 [Acacia crassicarpa]|uniref:Uncharacterized protein n=1 Tax=Acacia crassicarpa TaxID=499986 RepID=A0AAE1MX33_9FABA|nr:hypothetical protein QN277_016635 [Acacia crassicarpa]